MKIKSVTKSMTYYVTTDNLEIPDYRTGEGGSYWENLMGDSWEPVYNPDREKELQKLFLDYKDQLEEEEELWIR